MFRRICLIALMCFILLGAASSGISLAALLLMGSMILPAVFITVAREQQQE